MIGPLLSCGFKDEGASIAWALISISVLRESHHRTHYTGGVLALTWPVGGMDYYEDRRIGKWLHARRYPVLWIRIRRSPRTKKWHFSIDRFRTPWAPAS